MLESGLFTDAESKWCSRCKTVLPISAFDLNDRSKNNRLARVRSYCRPCWKSYFWERHLATFNITPERYYEILAEQNWRCAICKTDTPGGTFNMWNIDHDHACCAGRGSCGLCVRGLLCMRCNTALGWIRDRWDLAHALYEYLDKHIYLKEKMNVRSTCCTSTSNLIV